jgi:hypothetical protein
MGQIPLGRIIHASRKTQDILWIEARPWRSDSSLRSEFQIADGILQIWNLTFGIGHPEGHAFAAQGLRLNRHCPTNNPGQAGRRLCSRRNLFPSDLVQY